VVAGLTTFLTFAAVVLFGAFMGCAALADDLASRVTYRGSARGSDEPVTYPDDEPQRDQEAAWPR
jgi:hypothetical protein